MSDVNAIMRQIEREAKNKESKSKPKVTEEPLKKEVTERPTPRNMDEEVDKSTLGVAEDVETPIERPEKKSKAIPSKKSDKPLLDEMMAIDDHEDANERTMDDDAIVNESVESVESVDTEITHPEYHRESPETEFRQLDVMDKLAFQDVFVNDGGSIIYNSDHEKSVARNLSKGVIEQVVDDLRRQHVGVKVGIGENTITILETNRVFTSVTSLMRFLLVNGMDDDNIALQLARQLFLEKHPDGEKRTFNQKSVRTDEMDVYALVLSTKRDPERDLADKVEELIRTVDHSEERQRIMDRKLFEQSTESNELINGINIAASLLVLERLGLTDGRLPNSLEELRGFMSQDNVVKLSDQLGNDIAMDAVQRRRTIARNERTQSRSVPPNQRAIPPKRRSSKDVPNIRHT